MPSDLIDILTAVETNTFSAKTLLDMGIEHWCRAGLVNARWDKLTVIGKDILEAMRDKQMMDVLRKNVVGSGNDYDSGMWVKFPCMISELNDGYWILDAVAKCLHGKEQKKHDEAR